MKLADELDPAELKQGGTRAKIPTDDEFVALFPKIDELPENDPERGLLSSGALTVQFKNLGFDKNSLVGCRDRAEAAKKIVVIRGQPSNRVLAGLPDVVKAYEQLKAEKGGKK